MAKKKNKLVPDQWRRDWEYTHGTPFPENRCTGDTLGYVFDKIGHALQHPNTMIRLPREQFILGMLAEVIRKQELKFMEIKGDGNRPYLYYNLYE